MNLIKSYQLFLENHSYFDNVVTQFLIFNEKKLGVYFDRFDIINSDDICMNIIAYTKVGPKGEVPTVDKIIFDIIDFQTWLIESDTSLHKYRKSIYSDRTSEEEIMDMKTNIIREITYSKSEPNDYHKKLIDKIFNYDDVWVKSKDKITEIISTIKKFDIEEIEDRSVEFTDDLSGWSPQMMFGYTRSNHWQLMGNEYNIDDLTCSIIWNAWHTKEFGYDQSREFINIKLNYFLDENKPCLIFKMNFNNKEYIEKPMLYVENVVDRMIIRFKQLYNIEKVLLPYNRKERKYDANISKISDYDITFILK